ncbi:hypothetical protein [Streptomyces lonarensis]|uniref:Uncharacterized protein n=1 Tax=Streptomyces lonarensis TaxID=700599 RepID=A0A7X6CX04_9ACTN|nr:hypothetical protein [Streptomyces lonarensis]NJQ04010.1 hypothetical protein [Streptomyces lonarensis]
MPTFRTRLLLVVIAVQFSLVIALAAAFLLYAVDGSALVALGTGAGAFVTTMTLALGVYALLLPRDVEQ